MNWPTEAILGIHVAQLPLIWSVILLAAILRAFTGFGFALAAVPIFALFLSPGQSVVLSVSLALGIGITSAPDYWGKTPLRAMLPLMVTALLGTIAGASLLTQLSAKDFQLWIGLAVIAACAALAIYKPQHHRPRPILAGLTGILSGLLNGAFGIPGPPVVIYAMATESRPEQARALLLTFFTFSSIVALVSYGIAGLLGLQSLLLFLFSFPAMLAGDRLGLILFRRFGDSLYRQAAIVTLFIIGTTTVTRALLS